MKSCWIPLVLLNRNGSGECTAAQPILGLLGPGSNFFVSVLSPGGLSRHFHFNFPRDLPGCLGGIGRRQYRPPHDQIR